MSAEWEYWDSQFPGFGPRKSNSGRKTWVALYRVNDQLAFSHALPSSLACVRDIWDNR